MIHGSCDYCGAHSALEPVQIISVKLYVCDCCRERI